MKKCLLFLMLGSAHFCYAQMTDWKLEPSLKYDAICLLNTLTADSFYLNYYTADYNYFKDKISGDCKNALAGLYRKIKVDNQNIISAFLCLNFSAVEDTSLEQMLGTLDNPGDLQEHLKKSPYYDESDWKLFESVSSDLKTIFKNLIEIQFPKYWEENIKPKSEAFIDKVKPKLKDYDVIAEVEQYLGKQQGSSKIIVYVLYFSQPHGIKITGTRFLTDVAWNFNIVLRNATHEMMHPPYNYKSVEESIAKLNENDFLKKNFDNRNKDFGYNTFSGLIEEDCVQSLEQLINEKNGVAVDAKKRWQQNDEGLHKFAVILYLKMKADNYPVPGKNFGDYFNTAVSQLLKEDLNKMYSDYYSN